MENITLEEIESILDEKVRPELARHGGDIQIESYADGVLSVRLLGQCCGCPSAEFTMQDIVEEEIQKVFPQIHQIQLSTGVSDSLIEEARAILKKRHEANT